MGMMVAATPDLFHHNLTKSTAFWAKLKELSTIWKESRAKKIVAKQEYPKIRGSSSTIAVITTPIAVFGSFQRVTASAAAMMASLTKLRRCSDSRGAAAPSSLDQNQVKHNPTSRHQHNKSRTSGSREKYTMSER